MMRFSMKLMVIISGLLIMSIPLYAQKNIVFGKAGNQVIDQDFVNMMQLLNPEFGFNPDKEVFSNRLLKDYVLTKVNADDARSKKLNEDPIVRKNIELIKQLAEDKYLASLKAKLGSDTAYKITEAEAKKYYDAHFQMFITPGQYSYLNADIGDTVAYPITEIKKKMKQFAAMITDEFKTGDNDKYSMVFIKNRSISTYDDQFSLLSKLKEGDFAETMNGKRKIIFLLMNKTPEVIQSYEKVKETCLGNLLNEKRAKANEDFIEKAKKKYPINLSGEIFK